MLRLRFVVDCEVTMANKPDWMRSLEEKQAQNKLMLESAAQNEASAGESSRLALHNYGIGWLLILSMLPIIVSLKACRFLLTGNLSGITSIFKSMRPPLIVADRMASKCASMLRDTESYVFLVSTVRRNLLFSKLIPVGWSSVMRKANCSKMTRKQAA